MPSIFGHLHAETLVKWVGSSEVAIAQELLDLVATVVIEFFEIAHPEYLSEARRFGHVE